MKSNDRIPKDALAEIVDLKSNAVDLESMVLQRIHNLALAHSRGFLLSETVYYTADATWTKAD